MKPKIVVVGSVNTDMVVQVTELPMPGETVLGGDFVTAQGGKGANQAVAAARLGADVTLVGRLGRDNLGKQSFQVLQNEGLNLDFIVWDEQSPSGVALIMVNSQGENIIAVASGANARLTPDDVKAAESEIQQADCVLLQLEIPMATVQTAVELAKKHAVQVILNPAPATKLPKGLLNAVDILTPNESEVTALAGNYSPNLAADAAFLFFSQAAGLKALVVTLGDKGALILQGLKRIKSPAFNVTPQDTTGAGDSFNGALAVSLARGENLEQAVYFANAVAALTTTRAGAQPSLPTLAQVEEFLARASEK
jgi:ribokinase